MKTYHLKTILFTIFTCDIANFTYVKLFFFPKLMESNSFKTTLSLQGYSMDSTYADELYKVLLMSLHNTIFLLLGFHAFISFMALRKHNWAIKYYKGYTLSAFILTIVEVFFSITSLSPWHLVLIVTGLAYGFSYKEIKKKLVQ